MKLLFRSALTIMPAVCITGAVLPPGACFPFWRTPMSSVGLGPAVPAEAGTLTSSVSSIVCARMISARSPDLGPGQPNLLRAALAVVGGLALASVCVKGA